MKILLFLISPLLIFAKVHYVKVEPYETRILKSSVSALVLDVNLDIEGKVLDRGRVVHLDDTLDIHNLEASKKSMHLFDEMLILNKEIATLLKKTVDRKETAYKRLNKLSTVSRTQKDNAYSAFTSIKTQYLASKEKITNLEKQRLELEYKIMQLEDQIEKKSLILEHQYIYKVYVRKGDFVVPGAKLVEVMDISKAKLVLFLAPNELKDLEMKSVYIDGQKTKYTLDKLWKVTDDKFISSFRAEIYLSGSMKNFSDLVEVEIR